MHMLLTARSLLGGAVALGVVAIAWAALVSAAAVVEVSSGGRLALTSRLGCPAVVRRRLLAGIGIVLAGGGAAVAGSAVAVPPPTDPPVARLTGTGSTTLPI